VLCSLGFFSFFVFLCPSLPLDLVTPWCALCKMESTTWPLAVEGSDAPDDDAPHGAPAAPTPVVCEQCRKEPSKVSGRCRHVWCNWMERRQYCCPGCFVKTCSVECVRAHKLARDCDGRRKRSDFVALNNFTDENMWSGNERRPHYYELDSK